MPWVNQFPQTGIVALAGGKGTGKGKAIGALLQGRRWLSVTTLRSLARDQSAGWGGAFLNSADSAGGRLLKDGAPCDGAVVCVPSLLKVNELPANILVLDELPAILEMLLVSNLANKQGMRPLLIAEFERRVKEADLVLIASADLSDWALAYIEDIRAEKAFLVTSDRQPLDYPVRAFTGSKDQAIAEAFNAIKTLEPGKIILFHTDAKKLADTFSALLLEEGIENLLITSDTSGGDIEQGFLSSKGGDLPALVTSGIRAIVTSPSVKEGFSIEQNLECIHSVWDVSIGCSIGAESICQTLDRSRSQHIPRHIWVAPKGRAYSKISPSASASRFVEDFRRASSAKLRLVLQSLSPAVTESAKGLDWENRSGVLWTVAQIESQRNRGMGRLRDQVLALLEKEGKVITYAEPQATQGEAKLIATRLGTIRSRQELEWAQSVATAPAISESEAEALGHKEALSPDEKLSLEKFYLEKFYRTSITAADALWDQDGRRRSQIKHLEVILDPEKAEAIAANSIKNSPLTPQDWKAIKLQQEILEASGAAALIREIWAGAVTEIAPDRIAAIARFLKRHSKDVAIAFRFRNISKVSNTQAAFLALDWVGFQRVSQRQRLPGGKIGRRYFVDAEHLELLQKIVARRCDPPSEESIEDQGGGSAEWFDFAALEISLGLTGLPSDTTEDLIELYKSSPSQSTVEAIASIVSEIRAKSA